ncbi:MAG: hypothetical protein ACI8QZ_000786 [Chlamydiales bacterium]|jgi:hypothetical protein
MWNRTLKQSSQRGAAQIVVLVILATLGTLSAGYVRFLGASTKETVSSTDDRRAFLLAEAGLAEALTSIAQGHTGNVGNAGTPVALGGGLFWVEAADIGGEQKRLTVTACIGSGRSSLDIVVEGDGVDNPLFHSTLSSRDTLTMSSTTMVDSYDSSVGTYASHTTTVTDGITRANANGHVSSNAGIVLNSDAKVIGDATPGPADVVSFATGSYVDGSTTPAPELMVFPPIDAPTLVSSGAYTVPDGQTRTVPSGDHRFDDLGISKDGVLNIVGPATIVVDNFIGGKDARLMIDASNGPVSIYVQGDYQHFAGFEADAVTGSPMALAFFIEGTAPVVFPSAVAVRGGYYAPNADITFSANNEAWGAFSANGISMSSGMKFHYDEHLAEYWSDDSDGSDAPPVRVLAWGKGYLSNDNLRSDRKDAFRILGVDHVDLPTPAEGWDLGVVIE